MNPATARAFRLSPFTAPLQRFDLPLLLLRSVLGSRLDDRGLVTIATDSQGLAVGQADDRVDIVLHFLDSPPLQGGCLIDIRLLYLRSVLRDDLGRRGGCWSRCGIRGLGRIWRRGGSGWETQDGAADR